MNQATLTGRPILYIGRKLNILIPNSRFMLNSRLLCITGMQVLSTKLIPEHSPKQARRRNIVSATKQRGMISTKRLYEKRRGNRCFHCPHTHDR